MRRKARILLSLAFHFFVDEGLIFNYFRRFLSPFWRSIGSLLPFGFGVWCPLRAGWVFPVRIWFPLFSVGLVHGVLISFLQKEVELPAQEAVHEEKVECTSPVEAAMFSGLQVGRGGASIRNRKVQGGKYFMYVLPKTIMLTQ